MRVTYESNDGDDIHCKEVRNRNYNRDLLGVLEHVLLPELQQVDGEKALLHDDGLDVGKDCGCGKSEDRQAGRQTERKKDR